MIVTIVIALIRRNFITPLCGEVDPGVHQADSGRSTQRRQHVRRLTPGSAPRLPSPACSTSLAERNQQSLRNADEGRGHALTAACVAHHARMIGACHDEGITDVVMLVNNSDDVLHFEIVTEEGVPFDLVDNARPGETIRLLEWTGTEFL